ncbi:MAG: TonB-dependent receptor [bacterium]
MIYRNTLYRNAVVVFLSGIVFMTAVPTIALADGAKALEEIIVTARKREESLQSVPTSVSVLSSEELDARGAASLDVVGQIAPNVHFENAQPTSGIKSPTVFIRGMGQADFIIVEDPAVGIYLDGVFTGRMVGNAFDLIDVERIEVLRGPQGTLFGRNTIGGAVNVVSKKPGTEFDASFRLAVGDEGHEEARVTINVPLGEQFGGRLTAFSRERDGYVKAQQYDDYDLGSEDVWGLRLQLGGAISENLSVDFAYDYSKDTSTPGAAVPLAGLGFFNGQQAAGPGAPGVFGNFWNVFWSGDPGSCTTATGQATNLACYGPVYNTGDDYSNNSVFTDFDGNPVKADQDIEVWGANLTIDWAVGNLNIKSITSYREFDIFLFNDLDYSPHIVFANTHPEYSQEQFSQEFQITGLAMEDRLHYVVGLYYFEEEGLEDIFNQIAHVPFLGVTPPNFFFQNLARRIDNESKAIYVQLTYDITDRWHATVGSRWTESDKTFVMDTERTLSFSQQFGDLSVSETTPMFSLSWDATDSSMAYFTYSEGFRDGGYPARFTGAVPDPLPTYDPEFVKNYEFGYKTTFANGRARANIALFQMDYEDMQISATSNLPGVGDNTSKANLGNATISGFELELTALVGDNLTLGLNLGVLDDEIDSFKGTLVSSGITLSKSNDLPFTPDYTVALTAAYDIPLENGAGITLRADYSMKDDYYSRTENIPEVLEKDHKTLNVSARYFSPDDQWEAGVIIRNATDEFYFQSRSIFSAFSMGFGQPVRPRSTSVFLKYNL